MTGRLGRIATRTGFQLRSGTVAALLAEPAVGPLEAAPTTLFLPGFTGSKEDFLPLLRPLGVAGHRAVAIDQRGQYESDWAAAPTGYQLAALAEDVCELADELRRTATALHLVGHSFGGLVARAAVLADPALFDSLTLMSSGPAAITGQRREVLDAAAPVLAEQGMAGLWELMQRRAQADPRFVASPPALQAFLHRRFMATDPTGLHEMSRVLREIGDHTAELAGCGRPLLVLHGVDDDAWPPATQAEMAGRLGARYAVIENAAHSPAVENPPDTLAALIGFWAASSS